VLAGALSIDISRFKRRKGNAEWAGPCPVHAPKKNRTAFSYSQDGKFHCFSCDAKGRGAIDLTMKVRGVGFQEAVSIVEPFSGSAITLPAKASQVRQLQVQPAQNEPFKGTYEKFKAESDWLKERGLSPEACERYGVFEYSNPSRRSQYNGSVMLRISRWSDGECVGYLSRNIGDVTPEKPKYRSPDGLHKVLEMLGAWELKERAPHRMIYSVESPFAVVKFSQMGLPVVSPFGWSLSEQQVAIVAELAKGVICLPDSDKSEAFAPYAHQLSKRVWVRCPVMPQA
jgi:DNA primase